MSSLRFASAAVFALLSTCGLPAQSSSTQAKIDQEFLAIPSARLAGEELKTLTAAPHIASSKEDYATAEYVAAKFKAAGLETSVVPYKVWINLPKEIRLTATSPDGKVLMTGPTREHVEGDPFDKDPRVVTPYNSSSPSGDITAEVVYANYGRPEDFEQLDRMHIGVRGKIVLVRYGENFRGVKVYLAQLHGAAGVIIYSDPADDGFVKGPVWPLGPYRPETGVQRGSVQYIFEYPGDATTPGTASTPDLPLSKRVPPAQAVSQPTIPSTPISWQDAQPILRALGGPAVPHEWQGGLPFAYHAGPGGVSVHMLLKQDYAYRTIWDVIGTIEGTTYPAEWVIAGNHRDAWVFGAVDPSSGTAAMLEAVHGVGELLKTGWKPKRKIVFGSWDAEEEGLIGSTEWAEAHVGQMGRAVAYFNTDVAVAGPDFTSSAVPSLKQFVRDVTREVPSARGATVYDQWKSAQTAAAHKRVNNGFNQAHNNATEGDDVEVGDLGSGSDFTPFFQHFGVPSTDVGSDGPYGVYHSAFDNFAWYTKNADPDFSLLQQQARVLGLEVLHMADAEVLPYDYPAYARALTAYLEAARKKAAKAGISPLDFEAALDAVRRFSAAALDIAERKRQAGDVAGLNRTLLQVEHDLLSPEGLPERPWYKHTIYAPGVFTGYAAVVIPGVNEAIDSRNAVRAQEQLAAVTAAINRAAATLEGVK